MLDFMKVKIKIIYNIIKSCFSDPFNDTLIDTTTGELSREMKELIRTRGMDR